MIAHAPSGLASFTTELLTTTVIGLALLGPAFAQGSPVSGISAEAAAVKPEGPENLLTLLPLLLTSPDRRQLAVSLAESIRNGDLKKAESSLNAAIEVGTLAIVLVDHLKDPSLVSTLQDLGIRSDERPAPEPLVVKAASESCTAASAAATTNLAEMQQALEQEQSYSSMVSQTLTSLTQEHSALAARLEAEAASHSSSTSEMQQALQREQDQSKATRDELDKLRNEYGALKNAAEQDKTSITAALSERETLLQRERERSAQAAERLASAETELHDLRAVSDQRTAAASTKVAELQKALAWATIRSDMLTEELVDTTEELHVLQDSHRPSATPVVFRLAATGTEPPLAAPEQITQIQPPPPETKTILAEAARSLVDTTSALSPKDLNTVVVASLPDGIQPLSLDVATTPAQSPLPVTELRVSAPAETPKAEGRLTTRAEELFRKGDVSGARLLLERALSTGHAHAAFLLAETYDPNVLSKLGVLGIRGDAAKAREFYAQARAMGIVQAGDRMEALK